MQEPGEEVVGEYLRLFSGCSFVEYNLYTPDEQGEIDVVGINTKDKIVYICEVTTHLVTGLLYVNPKNNKSDNVARLTNKFRKDIRYANKYFIDYEKCFMFWSPIVNKSKPSAKNNQLRDVEEIKANLLSEFNVELELVINQTYANNLAQLREYAAKETKALQSPVMRLMQIEEKLSKHINTLNAKNKHQ